MAVSLSNLGENGLGAGHERKYAIKHGPAVKTRLRPEDTEYHETRMDMSRTSV